MLVQPISRVRHLQLDGWDVFLPDQGLIAGSQGSMSCLLGPANLSASRRHIYPQGLRASRHYIGSRRKYNVINSYKGSTLPEPLFTIHFEAFNMRVPELEQVLHHGTAPILGYRVPRPKHRVLKLFFAFKTLPLLCLLEVHRILPISRRATSQERLAKMWLAKGGAKRWLLQALPGPLLFFLPTPSGATLIAITLPLAKDCDAWCNSILRQTTFTEKLSWESLNADPGSR